MHKSNTSPARSANALRPGLLSAVALACLLAGCSMIPTYERPTAPVSQQWPDGGAPRASAQAGSPVAASDLPWQDFVGDDRLRRLIALALDNNRDLRVAALSIEQARAQYRIRRADLAPTLNLGVSGTRQPAVDGSGGNTTFYNVGLAVTSWEIDFFGRIASLKEAALDQYLATTEGRNAAQMTLVASIANSWLSLQANDALLELTRQTLATREDSQRLTRLRFDQGVSSALDLRQADSLSAAARATLAQQQRLRTQDLNALTLLAGAAVPADLLPTADAPVNVFSPLPEGVPSEVLAQRPDVLQAERQLMAANANIGAARAAFFPRIALTASAGTASSQLSGLFEGGSWGLTLARQALLPIFDAGRNKANLESSKIAREIAVAQYEKSIQVAFREVADALAGRATLTDQLAATEAQAQAESERFRLADLRYRNGIASYLDVLDAQRALFATQQAVAQIRLASQQNEVSLYRALGGGWRPAAPATDVDGVSQPAG